MVSDPHLLLLRSTLVSEFEMRLRGLVEARAADFTLEFPEGLLSVIASHVLQEAETEPMGLSGEKTDRLSLLISTAERRLPFVPLFLVISTTNRRLPLWTWCS